MFCTSCNADIGTRLPKFCPQCGVPLPADDLLELVGSTPATSAQDDDATVLLPPRKAAKTPQDPLDALLTPDNDVPALLSPRKAAKTPQDPLDALLAPDDDSSKEPTAATPIPDDDVTVLLPPRRAAKAPQDPLDALLAPDDDTPALLSPRKAAKAPQDPLDALLAPDNDTAVLAHEAAETPQELTDVASIPDNSPTVQLFSRLPAGLLQNQASALPSQPDVSIDSSTAPTMTFSGRNTKRRKKKQKKARGHAQPSAPKPLIEPFIGTTQTEPVSPFREPSLATESFPPVFPEKNDRIVVEPLYPGSFPYPGPSSHPQSSRIPTQSIREGIPPAVFGLAVIILIVFLGGLWWWNSGEAVSLAEDVGEPLPMSEPLPKVVAPSRPPSAPASPAENTAAFNPEELPPEPESGFLMNIPSLPANQQQGRHNRYNPVITKDDDPLFTPPSPLPMPAPPVPPPAQRQAIAAPPEPVATPTPAEVPAEMPEIAETAAHDEMNDTPAPAPRVANPRPRPRQQAVPPWLGQMRSDLSNCQSFFCRERVRRQYCSDQWEGLPECRGASL